MTRCAESGGRERDARDAESLYPLLEHEVVPAFYNRDAAGSAALGGSACGAAWPN